MLGTSSIVLDAVIIVGISVAISMAVLWTIRWAIPHERLTPHNEVSGFVGNRVQEALWREALHMVDSGQATVQQIDDAVTYGPGMRWAIMGPMLTFHLAGGPGGMGHMLDHFGPALLEPWTRLEAPVLTPELRDRVVAGAAEAANGSSVAELARRRDAFLVDLLLLLERHRNGHA